MRSQEAATRADRYRRDREPTVQIPLETLLASTSAEHGKEKVNSSVLFGGFTTSRSPFQTTDRYSASSPQRMWMLACRTSASPMMLMAESSPLFHSAR